MAVLASIGGLFIGTVGLVIVKMEWNWELLYLPVYLLMLFLSIRVLSMFILIVIELFSKRLNDVHATIVRIFMWFLVIASATYVRLWTR